MQCCMRSHDFTKFQLWKNKTRWQHFLIITNINREGKINFLSTWEKDTMKISEVGISIFFRYTYSNKMIFFSTNLSSIANKKISSSQGEKINQHKIRHKYITVCTSSS